MRNDQWHILTRMVRNQEPEMIPFGFIIDSPWLPGWFGTSNIQFYFHDHVWFHANKKAVETFPDAIFIPGFWSEFGMCTEPSAFGAKQVWALLNMPHAEKIIYKPDDIDHLMKPNVRSDGLLPFMINRLRFYRPNIEKLGHNIKFAVARGPLNIASFLMGTTELMTALVMERSKVITLLDLITDFLLDWIRYQKEAIDSIEGILILDDLVGFIGEADFRELMLPRLKAIFSAFPSDVNIFHNDAQGLVCAPFLKDAGVHVFNFSFEHPLTEMQNAVGDAIILMGNIPPRDVMAQGKPEDVKHILTKSMKSVDDPKRVLWSVGGGMPQGVSTANIHAFIKTVAQFK